MQRFIASMLTLALLCALLAACAASETPASSQAPAAETPLLSSTQAATEAPTEAATKAYEGTELRVVFVTGQFSPNLEEHLPDFEEDTGISVTFESYAEAQLHQKCVTEFLAGNSTIDVIALNPTTNLPAYVKNGWLESLETYTEDPATVGDWDWDDFEQEWFPRCFSKEDGKLYAIPILGGRSMMYYRTDVFEKAGLVPPTTYDELLEVCAALNDPANNFYGIAMRGEKSALTSQLSRFIYSYGGSFIEDGVCVFDSTEAIDAVKFYGKLLGNYAPPGILSVGYNQLAQIFNTGQVAILIDSAALLTNLTDPAESQYAELVGITRTPTGPDGTTQEGYMNSWATAMYSGSQNKGAAWEFIKFATSKENLTINYLNGMTGYRGSIAKDPEVIENMYPGFLEARAFYDAESGFRNFDALPVMTSVTEARDAMGAPVVYSIETKGEGPNIDSMMQEAAAKVNELLKADGEYGEDYPF